jgi:hypothetical protein
MPRALCIAFHFWGSELENGSLHQSKVQCMKVFSSCHDSPWAVVIVGPFGVRGPPWCIRYPGALGQAEQMSIRGILAHVDFYYISRWWNGPLFLGYWPMLVESLGLAHLSFITNPTFSSGDVIWCWCWLVKHCWINPCDGWGIVAASLLHDDLKLCWIEWWSG